MFYILSINLFYKNYTNACLFVKIYNQSMNESKIISQIGSDQEDFESQLTQPYPNSSLLPKKKSKIQQLLLNLTRTHAELRAITRKLNLKQEDILVAFYKGLKILHSVDGKELLQKGKEFFEISQIIAFYLEEDQDIQPQFQELKKQHIKERMEAKRKQEQKFKKVESSKVEERAKEKQKQQVTNKTVKKVGNKQQEEKKQIRENRSQDTGKKIEQKPQVVGINDVSATRVKDYLNNPYAFQNTTDALKQKVDSMDEPEFYFPIIWENKADRGLQINDRVIKKFSKTQKYENICASKPFQNGETYRIKFKVVQYGTLAIGLLPSNFKYKTQKCVNVEKQQALKYIAFQNGGGKIQCCERTLQNGPKVGLQNNMDLEMIFNSKDMKVTFKSERLGQYPVDLPQNFKYYNLYLYFQMKQQHTCVRFY